MDRVWKLIVIVAVFGAEKASASQLRGIDTPAGFEPDDELQVGYSLPDTDRTTVNLFDAAGGFVLHVDYRVHFRSNNYIVVINSKPSNGGWGTETRINDLPFREGDSVALVVTRTDENTFQITFGQFPDERTISYTSRLPCADVRRIQWSGPDSTDFGYMFVWSTSSDKYIQVEV
uniref:Galectin n=1 Tax=Halisarca dujardinii TaxID=2583056 RepID=A0AA96S1R6_HALDU|nr:galectin-2-like protein [Halisarca dujardinii]